MPKPRKQKRETKRQYAGRLVPFYVREGYPQRQAVAIALRSAGIKKPKGRSKMRVVVKRDTRLSPQRRSKARSWVVFVNGLRATHSGTTKKQAEAVAARYRRAYKKTKTRGSR